MGIPLYAEITLAVYFFGYFLYIVYLVAVAIKFYKNNERPGSRELIQFMYTTVAVMIWPIILVVVALLAIFLMLTIAIDVVLPPCCRDREEEDEDEDYDSDDDDDSSDDETSVSDLGSVENGISTRRIRKLRKRRSRLPTLVKKLYLKFWRAETSEPQICAICFDDFTHRDGTVLTKSAAEQAKSIVQRTDARNSISRVLSATSLIDAPDKADNVEVMDVSFSSRSDVAVDFDVLSGYSQKTVCLYDYDTCVTPCGHAYHYRCITKWLKKKDTCPECRKFVQIKDCCLVYRSENSYSPVDDLDQGKSVYSSVPLGSNTCSTITHHVDLSVSRSTADLGTRNISTNSMSTLVHHHHSQYTDDNNNDEVILSARAMMAHHNNLLQDHHHQQHAGDDVTSSTNHLQVATPDDPSSRRGSSRLSGMISGSTSSSGSVEDIRLAHPNAVVTDDELEELRSEAHQTHS